MDKPHNEEKSSRIREDPRTEKKKRKPVYLKDRKTASGVTFRP